MLNSTRPGCTGVEFTLEFGVGWRGSDPMPDKVLTIKEVAALLKLAEKAVYAMEQAREIPAFKIHLPTATHQHTEPDQWIDAQQRVCESGRGNDDGR